MTEIDKVKLRFLNISERMTWNNFVNDSTKTAFYSLYNIYEWADLLYDSYKYKCFFLVVEKNGAISGCFPLVLIRSYIFGDRLISLPFTDHGCGPCVSDMDVQSLSYLIEGSKILAKKLKVDYIKICSPQIWMIPHFNSAGYKQIYDYSTFILNTNNTKDILWASLNKKTRNIIRKAEKNNISVQKSSSAKDINDIYSIHLDNMKFLGTPPHSRRFFEVIWDKYVKKHTMRVYIAKYHEKSIASIFIFPYRDSVRWGMGMTLSKYRHLNPISFLLWESIKWTADQGYPFFDFGGSRPDSNNFLFKKAWLGKNNVNVKHESLSHLFFFFNTISVTDVREQRYKLLTMLWKSALPSIVANNIGPYIRKEIGA